MKVLLSADSSGVPVRYSKRQSLGSAVSPRQKKHDSITENSTAKEGESTSPPTLITEGDVSPTKEDPNKPEKIENDRLETKPIHRRSHDTRLRVYCHFSYLQHVARNDHCE
jgi:hypothetical protein